VVHCSNLSEIGTSGITTGGDARAHAWLGRNALDTHDRGTLFFDDVGDLSQVLQCELLGLLRTSDASSSLTESASSAQVRIITSTTTELGEAVLKGHFRRDLFYRLNGAPVKLLPLRQRPGDIVALANHFLWLHARGSGQPTRSLGRDAIAALKQYSWPGNVRELENVVRFCVLTTSAVGLTAMDLRLENNRTFAREAAPPVVSDEPSHEMLAGLLTRLLQNPGAHLYDDVEGILVAEAFRATRGNQVHTATLLGISRNVVRTLLKKHGLLKPVGRLGE
jgi:DNA-binding NtrC family response regulator